MLQKFIVWKSRFGLTEIEDLSLEDMKKIRYLSLIELTAFFDALGIELKRNRVMRVKGRGMIFTFNDVCCAKVEVASY